MIANIAAHIIGVAAHRATEIKEIIARKKAEGETLTWEQGEAEFERIHSRPDVEETHGIR